MISIRSTLKALLAALLTAAALIFILAFIAFRTPDPHKLLSVFGTVAFFKSCLAGGAVSRRGEDAKILNTVLFTAVFILLCFVLSVTLGKSADIPRLLICYAGGVCASFLGALFLGGGKRKKPKGLKKYKGLRR